MQHRDRRLLVISAPAGFGKTTLALDFAAELQAPVCWYTLGQSDRDPVAFLCNLVQSLRARFPGFGRHTEARVATVNDLAKESADVAATLVADIQRDIGETFALVLDDLHHLDGCQAIADLVGTLIESVPHNCCVVLTSRTMPRLAVLPRLLAQREVAAVGADDLRFTADEIVELFREAYGMDVDQEQAVQLAADSGGWISGIILTTPSLWQGQLLRQTVGHKGRGGALFEYLSQEVYSQLPEELKRFLLSASILSELEPAFCDQLLDANDSLPLLEELERRNLFICRLDAASPLFRFHQLFQDFLRTRFEADNGQRYLDLNAKAAGAYERVGNWEESIRHYGLAGRWADCARVVAGAGEEMARAGRWQTLRRWVEGLPKDIQGSSGELLLWRAQAAVRSGDTDLAVRLCNQAMDQSERRHDIRGTVRALLCRGSALRLLGQPGACLADARRALLWLRDTPDELRLLADARRQLGSAYGQQGDFGRARQELEKALGLFMKTGELAEISRVHDQLGIACSQLGQLDRAAAHLEQAKQGWLNLSNWSELARTLNNCGELRRLKGEQEEALSELESALEAARRSGNTRAEAWALKTIGDVRQDRNEFESAISEHSASLALAKRALDSFLVARCTLAIGDSYRLMGQYQNAQVLIDQAVCQAEERNSGYELSLCLSALGQMKSARGEHKEAAAALRKSAKLLEPSGNKRELARICFYLAQASLSAGDRAGASRHLNKLASILIELGYVDFLLADARRAKGLVEYARLMAGGRNKFAELMAKLSGANASPECGYAARRIEAFAFGPGRVVVDAHEVRDTEWRSRKSKELLFYLLSHRKGATKEQIFEVLWPEWSPEKCNTCFHPTTYRLRRVLYPGCLSFGEGRYVLQPGDLHYDVDEFRNLISEATHLPKGSQGRISRLQQAITLYKGAFLEDFYSEWCSTLRQDLERQYAGALASLAGYYAARGQYPTAVELLEKCLAVDRYQEDAQYELMNVHLLAGNLSGANQCYHQYASLLRSELGVEPPQRMKDLMLTVANRV